jgi:hypothetical protein
MMTVQMFNISYLKAPHRAALYALATLCIGVSLVAAERATAQTPFYQTAPQEIAGHAASGEQLSFLVEKSRADFRSESVFPLRPNLGQLKLAA